MSEQKKDLVIGATLAAVLAAAYLSFEWLKPLIDLGVWLHS